jgi:hypothetical protein
LPRVADPTSPEIAGNAKVTYCSNAAMTATWKRWICLALFSLISVASNADTVIPVLKGDQRNLSLGLSGDNLMSIIKSLAPCCLSPPPPPQRYYVYVAAIVPSSGITAAFSGTYLLSDRRQWILYSGSTLPAYLSYLVGNEPLSVYLPIFDQLDLTSLTGTVVLVGFGTSDQEMLAARRYSVIFVVQ